MLILTLKNNTGKKNECKLMDPSHFFRYLIILSNHHTWIHLFLQCMAFRSVEVVILMCDLNLMEALTVHVCMCLFNSTNLIIEYWNMLLCVARFLWFLSRHGAYPASLFANEHCIYTFIHYIRVELYIILLCWAL